MRKRKDLTGMTFHKLTVIGPAEDYVSPTGKHVPQWECECSCAIHNRVIVKSTALTNKKYPTRSCGCIRNKPDKGYYISDNERLVLEWDYEKNIENPCDVALQSNINYCWVCQQCGYHYSAAPNSKIKGNGCPVCTSKICVTGINDIVTQYLREKDINRKNRLKTLIEHFPNREDDAKLYLPSMSSRVMFKCLDCGHLQERQIYNVFDHGFSCEVCSDGISYPNKFIYAIVKHLPVNNLQREWSEPDWLKINKRKCQYDLYFVYQGVEYVVEMDGGLGHGLLKYGTTEKDVEGKNRDIEKDRRAKQHNIKVIRIDCNYSDIKHRAEYIKHNILNSQLAELFDLSIINWDECDMFAQNNIMREICNYKTQNPSVSTKDIALLFSISTTTVNKYLRKGDELGWCEMPPYHIIKPVVQMDLDGNIIMRFRNAILADKAIWSDSHNHGNGIGKACKTHKPYKGFLFRFEDDLNELDTFINYTTLRSTNTSGVAGVYFDKQRKKWTASITVDGKTIHFLRHDNKIDAVKDRLEAELQYYGPQLAPQRYLFDQYGITKQNN